MSEIITNIEPYIFSFDLKELNSISIYCDPCKINEINEQDKTFEYEYEKVLSEFSPIVDIKTFGLIGFHKISFRGTKKKGIYIKDLIKDFYEEDSLINDKSNQILMQYAVPRNEANIRILGDLFVKNNKNKCKLFIEVMNCLTFKGNDNLIHDISSPYYDEVREICGIFKLPYIIPSNIKYKINLLGVKNITNICHMFNDCDHLFDVNNLNTIDTSNLTDFSYMFYGCSFLAKIEGISNYKTNKVTNMEGFFSRCERLIACSDVSKWDLTHVISISGFFNECKKLT